MTQALSKIGVIGDVHAENQNLETCVRFLRGQGLDAILCVGDVVDGTGCPNTCCELLVRERIHTVLGNHDLWVLNNENRGVANATPFDQLTKTSLEYLESLPRTLRFETIAGSLMLCHGLGDDIMAAVYETDTLDEIVSHSELYALYKEKNLRYVINGHAHHRSIREFGHLVIINAGSLLPELTPCCAVVDFDQKTVTYFDLIDGRQVSESETIRFS